VIVLALAFATTFVQDATPALDTRTLFAHPGLFSGDYAAARADVLAALEAAPDSPLAGVAVAELRAIDALCHDTLEPARLSALRARVDDGAALLGLSRHEIDVGDVRLFWPEPAPRVDTSDRDLVQHWFVLGPCPPLADDAPLWGSAAPDSPAFTWSRELRAHDGGALTWHAVPSEYGAVTPDGYAFPAGGDLFLVAWVAADIDVARVEIETDRALEVYWNGRLVGSERREGLTRSDHTLAVPVRFARGWNALVLRLADGEFESVAARVLELDGSVFRGDVRVLSDLGDAPGRYPSTAPAPALPACPVAAGAFGPLAAMADALLDGRPDRALAVAAEPDEIADEAIEAAWLRLRHRALTAARHLPSEVARRLRLEVEERLAELALDVPEIDAARARRLVSEDRPQDAVAIARALAEAHPRVPRFREDYVAALEALDTSGVMADLERARVLADFPSVDVLLHQAEDARARLDPAGELALLRRAAALDGRQAYRLVDRLTPGSWDQCAEALAFLARLESRDGDVEWIESRERAVWQALERWDLVEQALRADLDEHPHLPQRALALASHLALHGSTSGDSAAAEAEARALCERVLALAPGDTDATDLLVLLGGRDPVLEFFAGTAPDRDAAIARARASSGAESTVLVLDSQQTYIHRDGSSRTRVHRIELARDRTGTELLHEQSVLGEPVLQRVVTEDGSVYEPIVVDGSWVMPTLDPGSLVETVFEYESGGTPGVAPQLGPFAFASFSAPHVASRLVVHVPGGLPGRFETHAFAGTHEERPALGGVVHVFALEDQPMAIDEPVRPRDAELVPWVAFGASAELELLARGMRRAAAWQSDVAAEIEVELAALVERVRADTDAQFLPEALFQALAEHVLDFEGDGDTTDVWTLQRGDPLGLLAALYRLAGIEFEWVVLEPGLAPALLGPRVDPFLDEGDFGAFGLRLAPRHEGEEPTWLVAPPGVRGLPFGRVPAQLAGAAVVVLGDDGARRESLPPLDGRPQSEVELEIQLADDESAAVHMRLVMRDVQGPALRQALRDAEPQERSQYLEQMAGRLVAGLDVERVEVEDLDRLGHDLVVVATGTIRDYVKGSAAKPNVKAPWPPTGLSGAFGRGDRRWPVALRFLQTEVSRVTILPCAGFEIVAEPQRSEVVRPGLEFVLESSRRADGAFVVERRFTLTGLDVPAAEAAALAAELKAVETRDAARLDLRARSQ
jgi:hypothetical protein